MKWLFLFLWGSLFAENQWAYKLDGFPPVYYINLDAQPERKVYMENQFKEWGITNYTRISGYDGRKGDLREFIDGKYPNELKGRGPVIGCALSHLKAIKHWLLHSDEPVLMVMEDDCDLEVVKQWPFNWKDFYEKLPYNYDVVQLSIINPLGMQMRLHRRFANDYSAACYLIKRHYAQKLVNMHIRGEKYKLDNGVKPDPGAEMLIYNSGVVFSIPLFLFEVDLESAIQTKEHIDHYHVPIYKNFWNFWKTQAATADWAQLFDYDLFEVPLEYRKN